MSNPSAAAASATPAARHGVLLVNLGTPDEPTPAALRRYLAEFLSDRRVVDLPPLLWKPILHGVILRTRPRASAHKYAAVWQADGSPLLAISRRQAAALARVLGPQVPLELGMRYGNPSMAAGLDALRAAGCDAILVVPLYPQYSAATTGSVADALAAWTLRQRHVPTLRSTGAFPTDAGYIEALAAGVRRHWDARGRGERLILSFHGMPRKAIDLGDPYQAQCLATAQALQDCLALPPGLLEVSFQSRFGRAEWLQPYTEPRLQELARQGVRRVDLLCPGFVADCLETREEIALGARTTFLAAGGQEFHYLPCLNDDPAWIEALARLVRRDLSGWAAP